MLGKYKFNAQAVLSLSVLALIAVAIIGYAVFSSSRTSTNHPGSVVLAFADSKAGQIYLTDKAGKQLSKAPYSKYNYLSFQAIAPNGGVLASTNTGTGSESFIFTRNNEVKTYTGNTAKLLSSILVQTSHQIFFVDEKSVLFVYCADSNTTCLLQKLDLASEKTSKIVDTGVKQTNRYVPNVYLAGYDRQSHLAYLRVVNTTNKLGSFQNAVYEIDIAKTKAIRNFSIPPLATYATCLSPDSNKLVYTTFDAKNKLTVNILDLEKKSVQKIAWDKGTIPTGPGALRWSPDSKKLLLHTISINTTDQANGGKGPSPTVIAYIDLSKNNAIHTLRQITDPAHQTINGLGWLDDKTVIYQIKKSTADNAVEATNQTFQQPINSDSSAAFKAPTGDLLQPALY